MALSNELKSLSEQVKKMTTTIAKLILARSPHGTSSTDENIFDKLSNGLPRNMKMEQIAEFALTSKVILSYKIDYLNSFHDQLMKGLWKRSSNGCIYPLDNSYEKILYVEINEDYKFDSEELLEELRNFSVTHQVFDEMSESVLSINHGQTPLSEDNKEEIQQPNAYKMLDELPLPTFIKEMAEASKTTEVEPLQGDYELEPAIQKVQGDHFTHKQLCAKLCALEGSHLRDLVIIIANRMRFSTILGSLLKGCQFSDLMPHKVDDSYGSSYLECPYSEVNGKSFVMLNADYSSKFIENVVSALLLSDIDWFIGSSISMILGVNVYNPKIVEIEHTERSRLNCGSGSVGATFVNGILIPIFQPNVDPCTTWISIPYDPGILVIDLSPLVFTFTLEDKGVFRADEGISKEQTWLLLNPLVWSNYNANRMRESAVFLTRVFDPGGLWDTLLHSSWCSNPNLGFCMSYLRVCVLDELGNSNTWLPLLSKMSLSRIIAMINAFSLVHEMMLNIREGENVQFLIWDPGDTIVIAYELVRKLHVSRDSLAVVRRDVDTEFSNENVIVMKCWVRLMIEDGANYWKSTILWNARATKCQVANSSKLHSYFIANGRLLAIAEEIECSSQLLVLLDNAIERAAKFTFYQRRLSNYIKLVLITLDSWRIIWSSDSGRKYFSVISGIFMIEQISHFVYDPGGLQCNHSHVEAKVRFLQEAADLSPKPHAPEQMKSLRRFLSSKSVNSVTVRVFDPGGYGSELERTKRPQPYNYGGRQRVKDNRQSYVFDPGGLLTRLINAMESNSQPEMYRHVLFKYCLS